MSVTIDGVRLWQTQEDKNKTDGNVRVDSIYSEDSDKTLLTGLESIEELTYTGRATGIRLSQQSAYSSDPLTALAEWVVEMEEFVNANQGTGWTIDDGERGEQYNTVVQMFGWQRNKGAKFEVSWDLSGMWARGAMASKSRSPPSVSPSSSWTLDGTDLGSIDAYRQQKRQKLKPYPIAFADAGENEVLSQSGAFRRIMVRGEKVGGLNTFDNTIRSLVGQDQIVTFSEAFPGRDLDVMVKSFESTRESGLTRFGTYILEMIEGVSA
jgi:hypothetical protein